MLSRTREPDYLRRAYDELAAAQEAFLKAHAAWVDDPTSFASVVSVEAARHELAMAKGRLTLEEAFIDHRRDREDDKEWGAH